MHTHKLFSQSFVVILLLLGGSTTQAEEPALPAIAADLQGDEPAVKLEAARALTEQPRDAERMIPLLVAALTDERVGQEVPALIPAPSRRVADQAQWALGKYGTAAAGPVAKMLKHEKASVRRRAALVLADIGPDAAAIANDVAAALADEKDASARSAMLQAYGQVEQDSDALAKVLLRAMDDMSADYYALAIRLAGERKLQDEAVIFRSRTALDDPNTRWGSWSPDTAFPVPVRQDAALALGQIGPAAGEAAAKLREIMNSTQDENTWDTRGAAAFALIQVSDKVDQTALDLLMELARHPEKDTNAAEQAVEYLGKLGPKAAPALGLLRKACFTNADNEYGFDAYFRTQAIEAVGRVGGVDALPTLVQALQAEDSQDREAAAQAIGTLGPAAKSAVPQLIEAAQNDRGVLSYSARYYAIVALGKIGPEAKEAVSALKQISSDSQEPSLQAVAKEAIDNISPAGE